MKTVRFKNPSYVGDPVNVIKIYNEKEVDEPILVDISAMVEQCPPSFKFVEQITANVYAFLL